MYNKILVPVDGSQLAESVLPHVKSIASGCNVNSIIFIRVVEPVDILDLPVVRSIIKDEDLDKIEQDNIQKAEAYLKKIKKSNSFGSASITCVCLKGAAAECIAEYASNKEVDLIVISTHGRSGISRWLLGSVADRVLQSSCVPVLMVRAPGCIPDFI